MKKIIRTKSVLLCASLFLSAGIAKADVYYDYARVKSVSPIYEYVKIGGPVEQCYPHPL